MARTELAEEQARGFRGGAVRLLVSRLGDLGMLLSGASIVLIMLLIMVATVGRLVGFTLSGANEVSRYLLVVSIYLGLAYTLREDGFVRVRALEDRLGSATGRILQIFVTLLSLVYSGILSWFLWGLALESLEFGAQSIGVLGVPLYIPQMVMVVGVVLLSLELVVEVVFGAPEPRTGAGPPV
ncbi:MAG: TRAP transporter small permease subunit [Actinobacteria bacterium]|nr:TRAP transporter small permease subunit [Actinomycetota bacterium]